MQYIIPNLALNKVHVAKQQQDFTETQLNQIRQVVREEIRAALNNEQNLISATDEGGFINIDDAAAYLKMKKRTLYQYTSEQSIPFHKKGKRVLFRKDELAEWIRGLNKESKPGAANQ